MGHPTLNVGGRRNKDSSIPLEFLQMDGCRKTLRANQWRRFRQFPEVLKPLPGFESVERFEKKGG